MADDGDSAANGRTPVTIIGVVRDSRFRSIREPVEPIVFVYDRYQPSWLLVRYQGNLTTIPVTVLNPKPGFAWKPLPQNNFIDRRALLAAIYPGRRIRAALLWTDGPRLMPIAEELLAAP